MASLSAVSSSSVTTSLLTSLSVPQELLVEIFSHLPVNQFSSVPCVCKEWNQAASDDQLWRTLFHRYCTGRLEKKISVKDQFKKSYCSLSQGSFSSQPFPLPMAGQTHHNLDEDTLISWTKNPSSFQTTTSCQVRDVKSHSLLREFHEKMTIPTCSHTEGNTHVTGHSDGTCRVWSLQEGKCNYTFSQSNSVTAIFLMGPLLFTGSPSGKCRIFNLKVNNLQKSISHHASKINCLDAMENRLAIGLEDGSCAVSNFETSECLIRFSAHQSPIKSCLFITKQILATGSPDKTVRLWNLTKKECFHFVTMDFTADARIDKITLRRNYESLLIGYGSKEEGSELKILDLRTLKDSTFFRTFTRENPMMTYAFHQKIICIYHRSYEIFNLISGETVLKQLVDLYEKADSREKCHELNFRFSRLPADIRYAIAEIFCNFDLPMKNILCLCYPNIPLARAYEQRFFDKWKQFTTSSSQLLVNGEKSRAIQIYLDKKKEISSPASANS